VSVQTKIICTLGPAVSGSDHINELVAAGVDVARRNLSHGTHADHARACQHVRAAADAAGRPVGILADLQGPKIRLGTFADGPVMWQPGDEVVITVEPVRGTAKRVSTTYAGLASDVHAGARLLVDDGNVALRVERVAGADVVCRVLEGGQVSDHKGISLPGVDISTPAFTSKDDADLRFALSLGVDLVALSFVRRPQDAVAVREVLSEHDASGVRVIAKIEKPEAVRRLDEIIEAFDGIMIARGDLGVEMPLEDLPLVQKQAITVAREHAKPAIVATQMLQSMVSQFRPTRAEVSDVANAVFDGADALMLSGETSVGEHPVAAVETMARIARAAEQGSSAHVPRIALTRMTRSAALAGAAVDVADAVGACVLVAFTESGGSARLLARHRPSVPLIAFTTQPIVRRQLALSWGVESFVMPTVSTTDEMVRQVDTELQRLGRAAPGDLVVFVAGIPPRTVGGTDLVHVHCIGENGSVPAPSAR
jgi:pyruvate kinase